jgi:hypothetical protein
MQLRQKQVCSSEITRNIKVVRYIKTHFFTKTAIANIDWELVSTRFRPFVEVRSQRSVEQTPQTVEAY